MTAKQINLQAFMKAKMNETDEHHLDPGQRAELVNTFILSALGVKEAEQPLYWDLICYSIKMLQLFAITQGEMDEGNFVKLTKILGGRIEALHYSGAIGEDSFLGPEREEHEGIWVDRIEKFLEEKEDD